MEVSLSPHVRCVHPDWTITAFDICDATIRSHNFRFALVSRRSRYRAGTRYFTRGIDEKGNVANFNETEQIVILQSSSGNSSVLCFVQIRGSIPLFWTEVNNLRYIPDLQIMELPATVSTLLRLMHINNSYPALHTSYSSSKPNC